MIGVGFKPFETVTVHIFTTDEMQTAKADSHGAFTSVYIIVRNLFAGGEHEVWA